MSAYSRFEIDMAVATSRTAVSRDSRLYRLALTARLERGENLYTAVENAVVDVENYLAKQKNRINRARNDERNLIR